MEPLYKRLIEFTREGVYRYTFEDGIILTANKGLVEILDLDCEPRDIEGKLLRDVMIYTEKEGKIREILEQDGEIHNYEYHFKTVTGKDKWVIHDSFVSSDPESGVRVVDAIVKDISPQKQFERRLRESEEMYRNLIENAGDGICIIQDGLLKFANRRLSELTGYDIPEAMDKPFTDFVSPDEAPKLMALYERLMTGKDDVQSYETIIKHKNGRRIEVNINASRVAHRGNHGAMVLIRDITEHKIAEKSARESERMEAISTVAGGVADNFNNILRVVRAHAASISDSMIPSTAAHTDARRIIRAVDHAFDLTGRLVSVAHFGEGTEKPDIGPVNLWKVVEDTREIVEPTLAEKSVSIQVKSRENMPYVMADAGNMIDVLVNMFMNAAEAMPRGGTIVVDTIERKIAKPKINPEAEGGVFVGLRVHDVGTGIDKDQLSHIFDPFYTTKKGVSHFGLGLPAANSMIRRWGGWIDVKSKLGAGTTFRLFLRKTTEPENKAEEFEEEKIEGLTVLIADDDISDLNFMKAALENENHKVLAAGNHEDALSTYKKHLNQVDLALIDAIMPGNNESKLVGEIVEINPAANLVVTSGFTRDFVRDLLPVGTWGFLQKPFEQRQVIEAVITAVKRQRKASKKTAARRTPPE